MAWSGRNLQLAGLFLFGSAAAGLLMSEIEPVGLGVWLQGLLLWLGMYPFVSATRFPIRNYWILLAVGLPIAVLARNAGAMRPVLQILTLTLFVASIVVLVARKLRRHN